MNAEEEDTRNLRPVRNRRISSSDFAQRSRLALVAAAGEGTGVYTIAMKDQLTALADRLLDIARFDVEAKLRGEISSLRSQLDAVKRDNANLRAQRLVDGR